MHYQHAFAIDIANRVPSFMREMKTLSTHEPVLASSSAEAKKIIANFSDADLDFDLLLVSIYEELDEDLLAHFKKLSRICVLGTSLKKIPLEYCSLRGISVKNISDYCDHDTAEWVIWRIIEFFRTRPEHQSSFDKNLGLVGAGAVGRIVLKVASALGMHVFVNTSGRDNHETLLKLGAHKICSKEEIFKSCSVISIHTPPNLEWLTHDLLASMPMHACLINTAMGRISSGNTLTKALTDRPDLILVMDKIAGMSYPELASRAMIYQQSAFDTVDAQGRLIAGFWHNLRAAQ